MITSRARLEPFFLTFALFLFALSFAFFAIQSGDVMMYLALARDFFLKGQWTVSDPYLYSLPSAPLHAMHEYLSYLIFYSAWWLAGWAGLIVFKIFLLSLLWGTVLLRVKPVSLAGMAFWTLAVLAASFRFIERSSLFSDLFLVILVALLLENKTITRGFILRLGILFFLWIQLHPGFPIGVVLLALWTVWRLGSKEFRNWRCFWLLVPFGLLLVNPLGLEGVLYPLRFAFNEALVFKRFNFEWFPSYHPAFRAAPETLAFWLLLLTSFVYLLRARRLWTFEAAIALVAALSAVQAVRFIPWASFVLVLVAAPRTSPTNRLERGLCLALAGLMLLIAFKNLTSGYTASSGPRVPEMTLDKNFFPVASVQFLEKNPIPGRLYNSQDFGSYLIWNGDIPIFTHGFVTDMDFYRNEVVAALQSADQFLALARKYGWTKLLIDKHGTYPYFYKILSPYPNWRIVAEDDASYLIYNLPDAH